MRENSTRELQGVVTRIGALDSERQDCVLKASAAFDDGDGLTAHQWNALLDIVEHK